MATRDDSEIPASGAVFTFGKSKFADNIPNKFWVKNDRVLQVSCGDEHTALIAETGRVFMFGPNDWGQLGLGEENKGANKPSCIKSLKHEKAKMVACGRSHTIVSTESGKLYSFGSNSDGQLGVPGTTGAHSPKCIESLQTDNFKTLAAGSDSSMVLTGDGKVFVWGGNEDGKLGLGETDSATEPTPLPMELPVVCIACGYYHTALITDDGKLYTMGETDSGKLGLPDDIKETNVPQEVTDVPGPVKSVSCGSNHTVALTETGDVYVFGDGESGQLGLGTEVLECSKPTQLKIPFKVSQVCCGQAFTAIISEKGQLYTFGDGRHGKLAHGSDQFSNQYKPFHCKRFSKFIVDTVACGGCHMLVTARPKALNGVEEEAEDKVDEMREGKQPLDATDSMGSPSLSRSLSARERRRDEVKRSFSTMNQTLPPLGHNRALPSLSATMPALKSSPAKVNGDAVSRSTPSEANGHLAHDKLSNGHDVDERFEEMKADISHSQKAIGSDDEKPAGSGSEGDAENDDEFGEDSGDRSKRKREKRTRHRRKKELEKSQRVDEEDEEGEKDEESENLELELSKQLIQQENSEQNGDEDKHSEKSEQEQKEKEEKDEDSWEDSATEMSPVSRSPIPVPRRRKDDDKASDRETEEEEKDEDLHSQAQISDEEKSVKDEIMKLDTKDGIIKSEDENEKEKEDKDANKKDKKDKKDKDKKDKKKSKDEDEKEKGDEDEDEEEDKVKEEKTKEKDKKDKKKDKKDKKKDKKKGKKDEEEEEDEEDEEEEDKNDKKSKDKTKDKKKEKDKKKKGKKGEEEEEGEDVEEDENEGDEKDKDKKSKDKKKDKKEDKKKKKTKDENDNTEKGTTKKSRTCTIL